MKKKIYDLIIIGAGPAGVSAAIYAKRAMIEVLIFEKDMVGGKLNKTDKIENYAGLRSIKGNSLAKLMNKQLVLLNFQIENQQIHSVRKTKNGNFILKAEDKKKFYSKSVIIATGTTEKKIGVKGESRLTNKGVSYCAVCDGFLFKNKKVMVVGGGYSGCESAIYLSKIVIKTN